MRSRGSCCPGSPDPPAEPVRPSRCLRALLALCAELFEALPGRWRLGGPAGRRPGAQRRLQGALRSDEFPDWAPQGCFVGVAVSPGCWGVALHCSALLPLQRGSPSCAETAPSRHSQWPSSSSAGTWSPQGWDSLPLPVSLLAGLQRWSGSVPGGTWGSRGALRALDQRPPLAFPAVWGLLCIKMVYLLFSFQICWGQCIGAET